MSFPMTRLVASSCPTPLKFLKEGCKRFSHRSPSFEYLKFWENKGVDFREKMKFSSSEGPGVTAEKSPKIWSQVLRAEAEMKLRGLVPFVHAMPAGSAVSMALHQASDGAHEHFQPLRSKNENFDLSWEKAQSQIPKVEERSQKSGLLSLSYAFASSLQRLESAFSWGFVNHFGRQQRFDLLNANASYLESCGFSEKRDQPYFDAARKLITKYCRLKRGDFIVIGVPKDKLTRWVYDSEPYNVPTGQDIFKKIESPFNSEESLIKLGAHLATLVICAETLDPKSGIVIVKANQKDEVDRFCRKDLQPMENLPLYRKMVVSMDDEDENIEEEKRMRWDKQVGQLAVAFKARDEDKLPSLNEEEDQFSYSDMPDSEF